MTHSLDDLFGTDDFVTRHIGPRPADLHRMLTTIGVDDMETLLAETVPATIRIDGELDLPSPRSEADVLAELR